MGLDPNRNPYVKVCIDASWDIGTGTNTECSDPLHDPNTTPPANEGESWAG